MSPAIVRGLLVAGVVWLVGLVAVAGYAMAVTRWPCELGNQR